MGASVGKDRVNIPNTWGSVAWEYVEPQFHEELSGTSPQPG